jgi:hypothetical protein
VPPCAIGFCLLGALTLVLGYAVCEVDSCLGGKPSTIATCSPPPVAPQKKIVIDIDRETRGQTRDRFPTPLPVHNWARPQLTLGTLTRSPAAPSAPFGHQAILLQPRPHWGPL